MIGWNDFSVGDHRISCPQCGRKPTDKTMGLTVTGDEHGVAHCFRCGYVETRREDRELTAEQRKAFHRKMEALRKQHDAEVRHRHSQAAAAAAIRWAAAEPVQSHPYLSVKGVGAYGIRIDGNMLLIPLRDASGALHNLQTINPEGDKRFTPGGRVKGLYHSIGRPSGKLVISEGYATAVAIHEDTGHAVAVAFNAGNLLPVAKALRAKFPCITLVIAADDDWKTEGNPGMTAATEAARAVGGLLAVPDFSGLARGDTDSDFLDLRRLSGVVEIAK